MTSFQRMVLVAAVLFMITAHVTDAVNKEGTCYQRKGCAGTPYYVAENVRLYICISKMYMYSIVSLNGHSL